MSDLVNEILRDPVRLRSVCQNVRDACGFTGTENLTGPQLRETMKSLLHGLRCENPSTVRLIQAELGAAVGSDNWQEVVEEAAFYDCTRRILVHVEADLHDRIRKLWWKKQDKESTPPLGQLRTSRHPSVGNAGSFSVSPAMTPAADGVNDSVLATVDCSRLPSQSVNDAVRLDSPTRLRQELRSVSPASLPYAPRAAVAKPEVADSPLRWAEPPEPLKPEHLTSARSQEKRSKWSMDATWEGAGDAKTKPQDLSPPTQAMTDAANVRSSLTRGQVGTALERPMSVAVPSTAPCALSRESTSLAHLQSGDWRLQPAIAPQSPCLYSRIGTPPEPDRGPFPPQERVPTDPGALHHRQVQTGAEVPALHEGLKDRALHDFPSLGHEAVVSFASVHGSASFPGPSRMISVDGLFADGAADLTSSLGAGRRPDPLEWMRKRILSGSLGVKAFSHSQGVWMPRKLAMNVTQGVLGIKDDRPGMRTFIYKISEIEHITKTAPLECSSPPPEELLAALHLRNGMMLCFLFESAEDCRLAIAVISRLCGFPIQRQSSLATSCGASSAAT